MGNAVIVIFGIMCFLKSIEYLRMDSRTAHDNEQMTMCIMMFFVFIFLFFFCNFWFPMLMGKLLDKVGKKKEDTNMKAKEQIHNVHSALQKMTGSQGVILGYNLCRVSVFYPCAFCDCVFG